MASTGTISCASIVTSTIEGTSTTLQIGSFTWPSIPPAPGTVLKTDSSGNLIFEETNRRTAIPVIDTTYQALVSDDIIGITGTLATTITLPPVGDKGVGDLIFISKEVAGNSVVTVVTGDGSLISGNTSATLSASYGSFKIYTNGVNWFALF